MIRHWWDNRQAFKRWRKLEPWRLPDRSLPWGDPEFRAFAEKLRPS